MRTVVFQRIGQQCTISEMEEARSWGDLNTTIKAETRRLCEGGNLATTCSTDFASMPKSEDFVRGKPLQQLAQTILHLYLNQQASER